MTKWLKSGAHAKRSGRRSTIVLASSLALILILISSATLELTRSPSPNKNVSSKVTTSSSTTSTTTSSRISTTTTTSFPTLTPGGIYSSQIRAENNLPGTSQWRITGIQSPGMISGFAQSTYATQGATVSLYISTPAASYKIQAFRMGWYQGLLGRLVWTSPTLVGVSQPSCLFLASSNTTECSNWSASYKLTVTNSFFPGDYLLKLTASNGGQEYIPLTVVDPSSNAAIAVMNAVTDWQAYNNYGGYSLYHGPAANYATRATKVSFDRPYDFGFGFGSGDFLGNELPLVALVEKLGLNVTYINSIYLNEHPQLVNNHEVVVSLGHDEYYSPTMRAALQNGVNSGKSVMFLGANAIFRRIRLDPSALGPDRIEVNYRDPYLDPLFGKNNAAVTANWPSFPDAAPESSLIGIQYQCNPVNAPMRITDPTSWVFAGTGLGFGSAIPHLIGSEFDQFIPFDPHPANLEILAHSPVLCHNRPYFSDMSYYSAPSGGGVFATGTNYWVASLTAGCPPFVGLCPDPATDQITENVLLAFAAGGVAYKHPSNANALSVYYHPPIPPLAPVAAPRPTALPTTTSSTTTSTTSSTTTSTTPPTTTSAPVSSTTSSSTSTSTPTSPPRSTTTSSELSSTSTS